MLAVLQNKFITIIVLALVLALFSLPAFLQIRKSLRDLSTPNRSGWNNFWSRVYILLSLPILIWALIVFLVIVWSIGK